MPPSGPPPGRGQPQNLIYSAPEGPPPAQDQATGGDGAQDPFGDHNEVTMTARQGIQAPLEPQPYQPQRHSYGLPPTDLDQSNGRNVHPEPPHAGQADEVGGATEQPMKPRYRF